MGTDGIWLVGEPNEHSGLVGRVRRAQPTATHTAAAAKRAGKLMLDGRDGTRQGVSMARRGMGAMPLAWCAFWLRRFSGTPPTLAVSHPYSRPHPTRVAHSTRQRGHLSERRRKLRCEGRTIARVFPLTFSWPLYVWKNGPPIYRPS